MGLFSGLGAMARGVEGRERSSEQPKGQTQPAQQAAGYPASVSQPTLREIAYGLHKRNVLDFWKAAANRPTPLTNQDTGQNLASPAYPTSHLLVAYHLVNGLSGFGLMPGITA